MRPGDRPFGERVWPANATELLVRRARFPGDAWRVRVEVGAFPGTKEEWTYPAGATRSSTSWTVLRLGR